jgi:hypothetical protein
MSILELFCSVDDFWQQFAPNWHHDLLTSGQRQRLRPTQMYPSELMTIVILFHQSHYRTFKAYYTEYAQRHLCSEFPTFRLVWQSGQWAVSNGTAKGALRYRSVSHSLSASTGTHSAAYLWPIWDRSRAH